MSRLPDCEFAVETTGSGHPAPRLVPWNLEHKTPFHLNRITAVFPL
ncbi:hypothetical protein [Mobiluncus mulieris]|nr:hypothetical protein [Mobiluncus mulieris]NMX11810.1 hypothetical protein [Mobiluncus mulieris]